ncbi:major capsid protein [Paracoccus phage vB_PthS_Pthi1]|uniref:Phage major capsid protein n=1 Tax=Paracoccus thiocyanatus TaxID=34006 RepID=A0A1N6SFG5_9RHOB|nr:phage major capsid protein [Paracoccus thiocyanatus]AZV00394.1 major capsid protein [Paracoccus phage vB_PthS_Pthi1]RDW14426.1 phage major capsid protein [Paracoccus thiocyanatus]SIQ39903.1 phage major capsid protein, HK97 family [Paracoccus thiocyanatus]
MAFDMEQAFGEFKAEFDKVTGNINKSAQAALDEAKRLGGLTEETKASVDKALAEQGELKGRLDEMQASARELEQRVANGVRGGAGAAKSLGQMVMDEATDKIRALAKSGVQGDQSLGVFNAITSLPGSGGVLVPERRESEIIAEPDKKLVVKDLVTVGQTDQPLLKFFREVARTGAAGIVPDDGVTVKPLIDKTWVSESEEVRTIAGRMEIHKHMLDDIPALRTDIDTTLTYEVNKVENAQILAGDGTGENMSGLITNATAYGQTAREPAGATILDRLRLAILQVAAAGYVVDANVLNIWDWAAAEMLKDTTGRYIFGNPFDGTATPRLWGRRIVDTEDMPEGDFLTGAFKMAATYYERQGIEILLSSENRDNFDKNMLTVRGEKRGVVAVKRPLALCYYTPTP